MFHPTLISYPMCPTLTLYVSDSHWVVDVEWSCEILKINQTCSMPNVSLHLKEPRFMSNVPPYLKKPYSTFQSKISISLKTPETYTLVSIVRYVFLRHVSMHTCSKYSLKNQFHEIDKKKIGSVKLSLQYFLAL